MAKNVPESGPGSRPDQYYKKVSDYVERGANSKHAQEVTADIKKMIDDINLEGVHKARDSKVSGRETKHQSLSQRLSDEQLIDAYEGKPKQVPAAFKMKDLSEENVAFAYEVVTEPLVWMFRLPVLAQARVKRFAKVFIQWARTHIPGGLPLLDHAILLAAFFTPLADAGRRKAKGEPAKYPRKSKVPEAPNLPTDSMPKDLRGGRAA